VQTLLDKVTIGKKEARPRDVRGRGEMDNRDGRVFKSSVRGKILLLKSKETQEGMEHFSCWGRMAPRVITHHIPHAWVHSPFQ